MIVVDSSVWISFFNGKETPQTLKLREVLGIEPLLVGDLMLCEVLQGARTESQARRLEKVLRAFELVPMLNDEIAVTAARNCRALRDRGVTVRKTIDVIIGTFCIVGGHKLLHADRDFEPMERYLGLESVPANWKVHER